MVKKLGAQMYTVRSHMDTPENVRETFRRLKSLGYDEVQTAGFCCVSADEYADIAKSEGIDVVGTHQSLESIIGKLDETVRIQKKLGAKFCGIDAYWNLSDKNEVNSFIKDANMAADKLWECGLKLTYHHHSHEFLQLEGNTTPWEMMVDGLDPEKISFVLDTHWIQRGGGDVRFWIEKLAGRIDIIHIKDFKIIKNEDGKLAPSPAEIGCGNMFWNGIMESAANAGVKHYCVEQETNFINDDPFESLKFSADYINKRFM